MQKLENLFGPGEVSQAVRAHVPKRGAFWETIPDEFSTGKGKQHLFTMASGEEPGDPVERLAEVVPLPQLHTSGMQRHAHLQRAGSSPHSVHLLQGLLCCQRRFESLRGSRKRRIERITHGLKDVTTAALDG